MKLDSIDDSDVNYIFVQVNVFFSDFFFKSSSLELINAAYPMISDTKD